MLSTFITEHGTLIVRTQDLRRIEDEPTYKDFAMNDLTIIGTQCVVEWERVGNTLNHRVVIGTAAENLARLRAEEFAAIAESAQYQQRIDKGLPMLPIVRGGKAATLR